jgi:RimJ/RimL family protein N-acetyltransferase
MPDCTAAPPAAAPLPAAAAGAAPGKADAAAPARELAWGRTRRLVLREFGPDDHDALQQMHSDPRVREHLVDDYPLHESAVVRLFLERIQEIYRRYEGLGIWHAGLLEAPVAPAQATAAGSAAPPSARFAGWFNLMPMAERPGEVEIGSRLLPLAWGSGLALEGAELLLDHALEDLGLSQVWGTCHPANRSAQAVLAALGFEALGVLPYDHGTAVHYRIELNAWRIYRNTPRAIRLRRALRSPSFRAADQTEGKRP